MKKYLNSRYVGRGGAAVGLTALLVLATAVPAFANTAKASADALKVTLGGTTVIDTGPFTASNDGTGQTTTGNPNPAISVLTQAENDLTVGVLAQEAQANNDGSSVACSGVTGAGGTIQIGMIPPCTADPGTNNGITIGGANGIDANVVYAWCNSPAGGGAPTGNAELVGLSIGGQTVFGPGTIPPMDDFPSSSSPIELNKQVTNPDGSLTVTALEVNLGGASGALIDVGQVTCFPSATTAPTSLIPTKGLPIAGGVAVLGLGAAYLRRRHNLAAARA